MYSFVIQDINNKIINKVFLILFRNFSLIEKSSGLLAERFKFKIKIIIRSIFIYIFSKSRLIIILRGQFNRTISS